MAKCIVFDFDGTLVISNEIKKQVFFEVTAYLPGSRNLLKQILADPDFGDRYKILRHLTSRLEKETGGSINSNALIDKYTAVCEKLISAAPEFPGARTALEGLSAKGFHLAISSATPVNTLKNIVSRRNIDHFFSHVFGAPESKEEHLFKIFSLETCKPNKTVLVGDSDVDRRTAKNLGCQFIGVGKGYDRFLVKPAYFLEDLSDLPAMLESLGIVA